ncbi:MAG: hypothetical protein AAF125_19590, partial [Chloroflexota bacterium]
IDLRAVFAELLTRWYLNLLWLIYRVRARYEQLALGLLWAALLPILEAIVIAFAFTQLLGRSSGQDSILFVVFLLSGRIIYSLFSTIVTRGRTGFRSLLGVMSRVYFPREITMLLTCGEALIDFSFVFVVTLLLSAFFGIWPTIYLVMLPIPVLLMLILALGVSFYLTWLSLVVRDVEQLTGVLLQLGFYTSVLFDIQQVSPQLRLLILLNPINAIIEAFRSVLIYGQPPSLAPTLLAGTISCIVFFTGYIFFKAREDRFTDFQ